MLDKNEFRKLLLKLNKDNRQTDFSDEDSIILDKLKESELFKNAQTILLYYPLKNEVNVLPLIDFCLSNNKKVALPRTFREKIEFYSIDNKWENSLQKGLYNTNEPINGQIIDNFSNRDMIVVPSLALGKDKSRLGHGKGYYDKFLKDNNHLIKIGLCRKHLLFDKLPTETYDVFLDGIISSN
jgi:5-formyltetrahydrofolate cyclo-ligase